MVGMVRVVEPTAPASRAWHPCEPAPTMLAGSPCGWGSLELEARRLLEPTLAEMRAEIQGRASGWPKRERMNLIDAVKARRRSAPFRTRTEELARIRADAKGRS
jgi:hypothetical protein